MNDRPGRRAIRGKSRIFSYVRISKASKEFGSWCKEEEVGKLVKEKEKGRAPVGHPTSNCNSMQPWRLHIAQSLSYPPESCLEKNGACLCSLTPPQGHELCMAGVSLVESQPIHKSLR